MRYGLIFGLVSLIFTPVFAAELDRSRYIGVDEVKPGMEAYCLTTYKGAEVEKFQMEVLSVVKGIEPGKDAIIVQGVDERFIHTGPVAGCSGSPVYIEGRLAGALAFGWGYSKDPVYGVTPIEEMLRVGEAKGGKEGGGRTGFSFDWTRPIDMKEVYSHVQEGLHRQSAGPNGRAILCPLVVSGLPGQACEELDAALGGLGFMAVGGIGGGTPAGEGRAAKLEPGATLALPLVSGDIKMDAVGTVTDVVDDKVYAFGHNLLGYGDIDLPIATGYVHTVVSTLSRSFKLGTSGEVVGALRRDESTGIFGIVGQKAKTLPLSITVERYNDSQNRRFDCQVALNKVLTPSLVSSAVAGAVMMVGGFPPDNTLEYQVDLKLEDGDEIAFGNISTTVGMSDLVSESVGAIALLLNNPYREVAPASAEIKVRVTDRNIISHIWSADVSETTVKMGDTIKVAVVIEAVLAGKKAYSYDLAIPKDLKPGKYQLIVTGGPGYVDFLRKTVPYRYTPENYDTLVESIKGALAIKRDKLYCMLVLPSSGIAVERAELPGLPDTKSLVLASSKRTLDAVPYQSWDEKTFDTGTVVADQKVIAITVEP
jgi:hypothetical protein